MQLRNGSSRPQPGHMQFNFPAEVAQIFRAALMMFGNDFVAGAVEAQRLAKWNVNIKRQRQREAAPPPLIECLLILIFGKSLNEAISSRIRGIAGSGNVKTLQQLLRQWQHHNRLMVVRLVNYVYS